MKKGFSMIMSVGMVFVFLVLTTIVIMSYNNTSKLIELKKFTSELFMIQDKIDDYVFRNNKYPIKEEVLFNYDNVDMLSKSQFSGCTKQNKLMTFYKIDFNAADITLNSRGFSDDTADLYVYSMETHKVYYLRGFKYDDFYHYTFNNEMYKLTGISKVN